MFGQNFYFSTIRKYVTLFGTLFDDISIIRTNSDGDLTAVIKVPITYAPKEKMLARVTQDPAIDRPTATPTLPFMSFEMTNLAYDSARKLNTVGRITTANGQSNNNYKYQYNPVPYNIGFRLYIYVKNPEDGTKIVEQILPFFTPDFTTTLKLIPEMSVTMDVPTIMNSISQEDTYDGNFLQRKAIIWTLDFTMKGYIYGPVKKYPIILFSNTVFYVPTGNAASGVNITDYSSYVHIQPGLTANGQPTSNASLSISPYDILATDDYGYIITEGDSDT
jgi:T4-like virus Myoviridae tail sheath stabiliser